MFDENLLHSLENYGLSNKEAKVYLTVLELGSSGVSTLARRSGIKRATLYGIVESLRKKNIVTETEKNKIKHYSAIHPQKLFDRYKDNYLAFKKHLPQLISLPGKFSNTPTIQFFDGQLNVDQMLYDYSDKRSQSMADYDHTRRGYQDPYFVDSYRPRLESHRSKNIPNEKIHLLSNSSETEKKIGKYREKNNARIIKTMKEPIDFDSTIWVCGDYIIMIMTQERNHYAYQIQEKVFAHNLRAMFKSLWLYNSVKIV